MTDVRAGVSDFYNAAAADYSAQYQGEQFKPGAPYPANYYRLQILANRLAHLRPRRLYEVGTGEGTPLAVVAGMGIEVAGCDIADAMVERTRTRLAGLNVPQDRIQRADIEDSVTFAGQLANGPFDAVVAFGVLPHVRNDAHFIRNMRMFIGGGGRMFVEFRNKLFSLFTFNRYTKEFILDDLLAGVATDIREQVSAELDRRLAINVPPPRPAPKPGAPGYDAILARFHNPFELIESFKREGLKVHHVHWYHYHPAMPMLQSALGERFRQEAMAMEHTTSDWKGYFLCSAGVVEAEWSGE
jgi:2-polyprenyl-3-methyl-5-hydroxy-6-metoxy-1,4-benzoquinol methylase